MVSCDTFTCTGAVRWTWFASSTPRGVCSKCHAFNEVSCGSKLLSESKTALVNPNLRADMRALHFSFFCSSLSTENRRRLDTAGNGQRLHSLHAACLDQLVGVFRP